MHTRNTRAYERAYAHSRTNAHTHAYTHTHPSLHQRMCMPTRAHAVWLLSDGAKLPKAKRRMQNDDEKMQSGDDAKNDSMMHNGDAT